MARRNQNSFIKRQKEIERMRKAKEKMDKRRGKKRTQEEPEGISLVPEPSKKPDEEDAADTPPDP